MDVGGKINNSLLYVNWFSILTSLPRWSGKEKQYADALAVEFESGTLEAEEGISLRRFLAEVIDWMIPGALVSPTFLTCPWLLHLS